MAYKKGEKLKTAFDSYGIGELLGEGSAGEVYTVTDSGGELLAAKVLNKAAVPAAQLRRLRHDLDFCARSTHPNVIRILDSGTAKKSASFYVLPLYAESLRAMISAGIAPERVLPLFGQILDGVEAGHLQHVPHLALKPENILYDAETDRIVVADFGIAHVVEEELLAASEKDDQAVLARFLHAAPEQKERDRELSHKADIFALGHILRAMFLGAAHPNNGNGSHLTVASVAPAYGYIDDMVSFMTSADPAERPPSIDEIKKQLIARGHEYLSRQRLNALKSEVIPESEAGDSFLANPIRIVSADYADGTIYFKLNTNPTPNWIAAFKNPRSAFSFYTGGEPETFVFSGDAMNVKLPGDANARQFVQYTKSYIDLANAQYREHVIAFHQRQMLAERENLRRQMAEEERRLRILMEIRNAL